MTAKIKRLAVAPAVPASLGTVGGRYRLERLLGSGGMGQVYLARDEQLGREVAVKLLPPEVASDPRRLARFRREGRLAASLNHSHLCTVYEVGEAEGRPFIVMEYVEGQSLRNRVADGPLPAAEVVELGLQVADALAEAHAHGLLHRDIKSANIVVTARNQVKVLDFGLAKRVAGCVGPDSTTESKDTLPGEVVGTLSYQSPEQALGHEVDQRSDLFSFGVVLYELLTGRLPFQGNSGPEVVDRILHGDPPSISRFVEHTPEEMVRIVRKLLAKDPEERYQSAREVVVDLRRLRAELSAAEGQAADAGPARRRRRALLLASFALAAALVAAAVGLAVRRAPAIQVRLEPIAHTTAPGWEDEPALSPDGSEVAYSAETDGNVDVWLMDSTGGQPLRLTDDPAEDRSPAWLPDGRELLFVSTRGGGSSSVWRVGRFGGSPTQVVENADQPAVSPDGSLVAFCRPGGAIGRLTIWVAPLSDPRAARQLTPAGLGVWDHLSPAWSPDGRTVAFSDFQDVWLVPADGPPPPRRLTDGCAAHRDPAWFPDGRTLMLTSWREGTVALWTVGRDGRGLTRVTAGTGPELHPSLSRDGALVAYSTRQAGPNVVVTDLATGRRERLASTAEDGSPDLRPDGGAVVFSSDREGGRQLWLQPLVDGRPAGPPSRLTDGPGRAAMPAFSPDGGSVVFYRIVDQRRALWVLHVGGGPPTRLTDGRDIDVSPSFSPDGRCIAFARTGLDQLGVWGIDLAPGRAAGAPRRLVAGGYDANTSAWSPTGDRLAFLAHGEVWLASGVTCPPAGPRPATRVTQGIDARDLAWAPDGRALLVSGVWDGKRLDLRRVVLDDPAAAPTMVLEIGDPAGEGTFGVTRDGRYVASVASGSRGDVWVARVVNARR